MNSFKHTHFHYFCGKPKVPWYIKLRRWALKKLGRALLWTWRRVIWAFVRSLGGTVYRLVMWVFRPLRRKAWPDPHPPQPPTPKSLPRPRVININPDPGKMPPGQPFSRSTRSKGRKPPRQFDLWGNS